MPLPVELQSFEKICDYDAIHAFAVLSDDFNPIHVDRAFAAGTEMGGIIAHGPMALGLVWQMLRASLGPEAMDGASLDVRFRRPVRENDVIRTGGVLREPGGSVYEVWVRNQDELPILAGKVAISAGG